MFTGQSGTDGNKYTSLCFQCAKKDVLGSFLGDGPLEFLNDVVINNLKGFWAAGLSALLSQKAFRTKTRKEVVGFC